MESNMNTSIRIGKSPFYGDQTFSHGLSRSGYFNKRESDELIQYGLTLSGLADGTLAPENEEEVQFVADLQSSEESSLYSVKLWKKYLKSVEKSRIHHGFAKSSAKSNDFSGESLSFA